MPKILNEALATEIVCVLRYKRHHYMASGTRPAGGRRVSPERQRGQARADRIAGRIVQLGGEPDFSPAGLAGRSHSEYVEDTALREMIGEDLVAERIVIDSHPRDRRVPRLRDPTTRRMMEGILAMEEEHAGDLASLLERIGCK